MMRCLNCGQAISAEAPTVHYETGHPDCWDYPPAAYRSDVATPEGDDQ